MRKNDQSQTMSKGSTVSPTRVRQNGASVESSDGQRRDCYTIQVSVKFAFVSLALSCLLAFSSGYAARVALIQQIVVLGQQQQQQQQQIYKEIPASDTSTGSSTNTLPPPKVRDDKEVPSTLYSSKITNTAASATAHTILLEKKKSGNKTASAAAAKELKWQECKVDENYEAQGEGCQVSTETSAKYDDDDDDDEDEQPHLPAGQHLLVDIKNVNHDFLNSEQRLAQAMVDVVWESDLTLLSYHCHALFPLGVSCVGVLLESHISFHTWPETGVITLDLFTCGSGLLLPILPIIERLFAIPQDMDDTSTDNEPPIMIWVHKLRGFRPEDDATSRALGRSDLATEILEVMDLDMKQQIATVKTDFQTVDIWDVIDPKFRDLLSYKKSISLSDPDSYEAKHPELYLPDRQVFLDGVLQSTRMGNEPYHEALVHPGMFAHPSPKRVAIIGGGEGATLREVLKHKTVQHVKMIEIDRGMVETSKEFLPSWNTCTDIVGSTKSCFDDPRAEVLYEDALAWFIDRFASTANGDKHEEKFDVIIMDALDPQDDIPFAEVLYNNDVFTQALYQALSDNGVIVMQLGETPDLEDITDIYTKSKNRAKLTYGLESVGFESMHAYEESHCAFSDPWSFLVACKDFSCRERWYSNSASVDLDIHKRILPTHSGSPTLKYFDGSTKSLYRIPTKPFEVNYCRQESSPSECASLQGYDPTIPNIPESFFEIKQTNRGTNKLGLFAKVDIARGSMILQEKSSNSVHFYPTTTNLIYETANLDPLAKKGLAGMLSVFDRYAFENNLFGNIGYDMHSSLLSLANHGCNGTHNIAADDSFIDITELTVDPTKLHGCHSSSKCSKGRWENVFNPIVERHLPHLVGGYDIATRDISKGEEILENLLEVIKTQDDWTYWVEHLRASCLADSAASSSL